MIYDLLLLKFNEDITNNIFIFLEHPTAVIIKEYWKDKQHFKDLFEYINNYLIESERLQDIFLFNQSIEHNYNNSFYSIDNINDLI